MTAAEQLAPTIPAPAHRPKLCGCGRIHDSYAWAALPYLGVMSDAVEAIELRNCPCGSTLAVELTS